MVQITYWCVDIWQHSAPLDILLGKYFSMERVLQVINLISYPRESNKNVLRALKTSLRFYSNWFSHKILVAVADARPQTKIGQMFKPHNRRRLKNRFLRKLQRQFRRRGVKLFLAAVGLSYDRVRNVNSFLKCKTHGKRNLFLFAVPSFKKLVDRAPFIAKTIREKTVCYLVSCTFVVACSCND